MILTARELIKLLKQYSDKVIVKDVKSIKSIIYLMRKYKCSDNISSMVEDYKVKYCVSSSSCYLVTIDFVQDNGECLEIYRRLDLESKSKEQAMSKAEAEIVKLFNEGNTIKNRLGVPIISKELLEKCINYKKNSVKEITPLISYSNIKYFTITCPNCNSKISEMENEENPRYNLPNIIGNGGTCICDNCKINLTIKK